MRDYLSRQVGTTETVTAEIVQLSIPGMAGRRRASTPKQYRDDLKRRTREARERAGIKREELIDLLSARAGVKVNLEAYKKWETRNPIPHNMIIPFCEITGTDPYELLTGEPFRIGRSREPAVALPFSRTKAAG